MTSLNISPVRFPFRKSANIVNRSKLREEKLSTEKKNGLAIQVKVDEIIECCSSREKKYSLPIYCYHSNTKSILGIFQTIMVNLIIDNTYDFEVYKAFDQHLIEKTVVESEEVTTVFNQRISNFWKRQGFELDPFQYFCFSVKTNANYKIRIHSIALDSRRVAIFLLGIFLFGHSARLSCYSLTYYLYNIINSIIIFIIIILFFISQLIPKEKCIVGFLEKDCILSLRDMQILVENLNIISNYIYVYILFLLLIGFDVYYKYTLYTQKLKPNNFMKFTLQLIGLALVTFSSFYFEAMIFIDILSIIIYYSKLSLPFKILPKRKLKLRFLSQNEYIYQGMIETPKALIELHKYCNRPDYNVWNAISRLREYKKFIKFMMTSDHIGDTIKISEMETDNEFGDITDLETDGHHCDFIGDHKNLKYLLTSDDE